MAMTYCILLTLALCRLAASQTYRLMMQASQSTAGAVGRMEVFLGGQWVSVCDSNWRNNTNNARAACNGLGLSGGVLYVNVTRYGRGDSVFYMDGVNCSTGAEAGLLSCQFNVSTACSGEVVGVQCGLPTGNTTVTNIVSASTTTSTQTTTAEVMTTTTPQISHGQTRLMTQTSDSTEGGVGRVEVFLGDQWVSVCDTNWRNNTNNAKVACNSLRFTSGVTYMNVTGYGQSSSVFRMDNVSCATGGKTGLLSCQFGLGVGCSGDVVGVICSQANDTMTVSQTTTTSTTKSTAATTRVTTSTSKPTTTSRTTKETTEDPCTKCPFNTYCFRGTATICVSCNKACNECGGPGPDECKKCQPGYRDAGGTCVMCTAGTYGDNCNGTCHCLEATACNTVSGECEGKCQKGYYAPPGCTTVCLNGTYGLDCLQLCHCLNDSACDKVLGFCPGNLCHPDWTSHGCSQRLPKLALPPEVVMAGCAYLVVQWPAWKVDKDFGDLPLAEYRLYMLLNGMQSQQWSEVRRLAHNASVTSYHVNLTSLQADAYYQFRVDVHYLDDNKVVNNTSLGFSSEPVLVPCIAITEKPPVTIPIILGTDVFSTMAATNKADKSIEVTWSIYPALTRFSWNVTLEYQKVGTGDCAAVTGTNVTAVKVNQTETVFRFASTESWSRYRFTLLAQGNGVISHVNDTETIHIISAEVAPTGIISNLGLADTRSRSVTLTWTSVPCAQRGGVLLHYYILVSKIGSELTNLTSLTVDGLSPYTNYTASVLYLNKVGQGPVSPDFSFTTEEDAPSAVTISNLVPGSTTITVYFQPPLEANGVLLEYQISYSDTPDFKLPASLTVNTSATDTPVIRRLTPYTDYYVKMRAATRAGYGPFGSVMTKRTLQARPFPPPALNPSNLTSNCIGVLWEQPDTSMVPVTGYLLKATEVRTGLVAWSVQLSVSISQYSRCDLQPATTYNLTIQSLYGGGQGDLTWAVFTTQHLDPPPPPPPLPVNVSTTTATVQLFGTTSVVGFPLTAYQVEVERLQAGGRRKRHEQVPGRTAAQLAPTEVGESYVLVIGDGRVYGGFSNDPLQPGQQYHVYFVILSTLNNLTKFSYSRMAEPLTTLIPPTTTILPPAPQSGNKIEGWVIGIIVAFILIIVIIIVAIILLILWRRRRGSMRDNQPYIELDEEKKTPKQQHDSEKYWNQITSTRESRYIIAGRECLPDSQVAPMGGEGVLQPGAMPVTFRKEFHSLPHKLEQATTLVAEQHPDRNRFPHILAYDHSRVELAKDSNSRCPYINANYMSGYKRQRAYIAAQSPYDDTTAVDFWRLIHQLNVKTVVMITNVVEDNIVKCTQYWPEQHGQVTIGRFLLELLDIMVYADFTVRVVSVREGREQYGRIVKLFEFTSWPDHGVPSDPIPFLYMRHKVSQCHGDDPGLILVHCGTGVARTGVFIAVDALIEQYSAEGRISVFSFVRKMRKERPLMVRTYKQYVFIYESIFEEFHAGDTMVDGETLKPKYHEWTRKNYKTNRSYLRDQFQLLQRLTRGPEEEECSTALLPLNAHRNRYPDVVPSDLHRPVLTTPASLSKTDYINAVFVDSYRQRNQFLLTQTPLHTTLVDFWRMVYDYRVQTVVMMENHHHEADSCAEYWPSDVNMKQWEPFFVETMAAFEQENVTIRNLKLVNTLSPRDPPRQVRQFQFNAWADTSFTPVSKTMVMDLINLVLEYQDNSEFPDSPIVVHCEDGATRSGLFVALMMICELMEEEGEVDVYHTIKHIMRRRPQVVHDYDQFRFCYKTLWDYLNLRMPGGTFTDTRSQNKTDRLYGVASLSLTSNLDSV